MPGQVQGLTAAGVVAAPKGYHCDGNGLYLVVREREAPGGKIAKSRFWVWRYKTGGKSREMGLGRAGGDPAAIPLVQARARAAELTLQRRLGIDPLDEQRKARGSSTAKPAAPAITFAEAMDRYIADNEKKWRSPKTRGAWRGRLAAYALPHFGGKPVAEITTQDVRAALDPVWHSKPNTASHLRGYIETILDYARVNGWREGENPARWKGHLALLIPPTRQIAPVRHHEAVAWREMGVFMPRLRAYDALGARALEFLILTATRTADVLYATWDEIDLAARTWTIPALGVKRDPATFQPRTTKTGKALRIPLSEATMQVLHNQQWLNPKREGYVFPGLGVGRPMSNMTMLQVMRRLGLTAVPHGFRSAFRDWVAEATDYPGEIAEAALAHTTGSRVEAAYRRGDLFEKRRRLMDDWADYVTAALRGPDASAAWPAHAYPLPV